MIESNQTEFTSKELEEIVEKTQQEINTSDPRFVSNEVRILANALKYAVENLAILDNAFIYLNKIVNRLTGLSNMSPEEKLLRAIYAEEKLEKLLQNKDKIIEQLRSHYDNCPNNPLYVKKILGDPIKGVEIRSCTCGNNPHLEFCPHYKN